MGLISLDAVGPTSTELPSSARLGDAPGLQALSEPSPRLDLAPRHILQQDGPPPSWLRRNTAPAGAAVAVHVGFVLALLALLSFRDPDPEASRESVIPVEMVSLPPEKPPAPKPAAPESPPPKPVQQAAAPPTPAPPVAPDPKPPAPPAVQPPDATPPQVPTPPKLLAPPPEPSRAATQARDTKTANLEPDEHQADQALREARPAAVPQTLTTTDPKASFAVPTFSQAKSDPADKPTPPISARAPSETEKLAAALPMDTSALPMTFRAVLSGNGAQISAAYKGLVYGRFSRNAEIGERARRLHLKGQVIVGFTVDDSGAIKSLSVVQSSGSAALDGLGLDMIRAAAPFPAPPPDAQRSFMPALAFGD